MRITPDRSADRNDLLPDPLRTALFSLEPRLGIHAVGVSVLPYCLIHAHKPLPEALGSIVAGYVLGVLALRTRSIGGGVLVHCGVALTMDALALVRSGVWATMWG